MVKIYAVVLILGVIALIAWIYFHAHSENESKPGLDPERRYGLSGRRLVAGLVGFGMAGMSAEFSPRDIPWPTALVLALIGAAASIWWAGKEWGASEPAAATRND